MDAYFELTLHEDGTKWELKRGAMGVTHKERARRQFIPKQIFEIEE